MISSAGSSGGTGPGTTDATTGGVDESDESDDHGPLWDIGPFPDQPGFEEPGCGWCDPGLEYCCTPGRRPDVPDQQPDECVPLPRACVGDETCECVVGELRGATLDTCGLWDSGAVHIGACLR